jgi:hypothetical protein
MELKEKRTEEVKIYLTEEEREKIQDIADKNGLSVSSWGRSKLLESLRQKVEA